MTGTDATGTDANTQDPRPAVTTHPLLGVAGVLLGALIATCTGRLMNVDLEDIRGALHLGVDEGSWINTTFNASPMFIGDFSVYLGGLLGPRRVLLACTLTDSRLLGLQHAFTSHSTGLSAAGRAAEVLGLRVRQQAYTLAISDSFLLLATCCVACLVVVSFMSKVPTQYRQVPAAPVEAK
jgi:hypothetical protein